MSVWPIDDPAGTHPSDAAMYEPYPWDEDPEGAAWDRDEPARRYRGRGPRCGHARRHVDRRGYGFRRARVARMHTEPMKDSDGTFQAPKDAGVTCRECKGGPVTCETWESSCGGYEDYKYTCKARGHTWWVDGIDS